jgi:hypothetical protein
MDGFELQIWWNKVGGGGIIVVKENDKSIVNLS